MSNKILNIYIMKALTDQEINTIASKYNIKINGIYNRNTVPEHLSSGWYILNLDLKGASGTHWTAFCVSKKLPHVYFDSFGQMPPQYLHELMGKFMYSVLPIQDPISHSCGWFALMCIFVCQNGDDHAFEKFIRQFTSNCDVNEKILKRFWEKIA